MDSFGITAPRHYGIDSGDAYIEVAVEEVIDKGWHSMSGVVINRSLESLWVVETDNGPAVAHLLGPMRRSPRGTDADGIKTVSGKRITRHPSDLGTTTWWKITSIETATLSNGPTPDRFIVIDAGISVPEHEFGVVTYDESAWGEAI